MKRCLTVLCLLLAARAVAFARFSSPPLPAGGSADTEVATNILFHVDTARLASFSFAVASSPCVTNEILVAIGADADGDRDLSPDEADVVFGCDCGMWYRADLRTGAMLQQSTNVLVFTRRGFDPSWTVAKIVRRGLGEIAEHVTADEEHVRFDVRIR